MIRTRVAARLLAAAAVIAAVLAPARTGTSQIAVGKACELLTAAELQAVLGSGVSLAAGSFSHVATCRGEGQRGTQVVLQLFKEADDAASSDVRKAGIDAVTSIGMQVTTRTSGGITCTTIVPPAKLAYLGFTTTCTVVSKAPMYARVEIIAKTEKDMVRMDALHELAMKMTDRF